MTRREAVRVRLAVKLAREELDAHRLQVPAEVTEALDVAGQIAGSYLVPVARPSLYVVAR
jgi:hypothetical protein